jgi:hypothetical protein
MLVLACACATVRAADYHVEQGHPRAAEENSGTPDLPFLTISRGVRAAGPGDTVVVGGGTYREQVTVGKSGLVLQAAEGQRPAIDGVGATKFGIVVADGVSDVTIDGFEVTRQTLKGIVVADRRSRNVSIRNCLVHHIWEKGIDVRGADHRIEGNVIHHIGNDQEAMGIRLDWTSGCLVAGNDVFLCKKTAVRDQTGTENLIRDNLLHDCWCGLDFNGSSGSVASNNCLYANCIGFNPKHLNGRAGWNRFIRNTCHAHSGNHVSIAVNRADGATGPDPDLDYLEIRNNIFSACGFSHLWNRPSIVGENVIIDGNLYHSPPGRPAYVYHDEWPQSGRPGLRTLAELREKTPFAANAQEGDPCLEAPDDGLCGYPEDSIAASAGVDLEDGLGRHVGARGLRRPAAVFRRVALRPVEASENLDLAGRTVDGVYYTDWHSGDAKANQWIVYELPDGRPFTHLMLVPSGHKVEFNVRHFAFEVSDDGVRYTKLLEGENNDSGSRFIYELEGPVVARYLRFRMVDKFPDDGQAWSSPNLRFDELEAGYCDPPLVPRR